MTRVFLPTFCAAVASAMVLAFIPGRAHAATTVCTPVFMPPDVAPGSPISANLGSTTPCPASPVTVSLSTVGSGLSSQQLGNVFTTYDMLSGLGTNNFTRTSISSVGIGALGDAGSGPVTQSFSVTYSQPVTDPYFFFSWIENYSEYQFSGPINLLQANGASSFGNNVISTGSNNPDSGFVVQMIGTSNTFSFDIKNYSSDNTVAAFSTGAADFAPSQVPAPLPLAGVGLAYSMSRRLRRRISR